MRHNMLRSRIELPAESAMVLPHMLHQSISRSFTRVSKVVQYFRRGRISFPATLAPELKFEEKDSSLRSEPALLRRQLEAQA